MDAMEVSTKPTSTLLEGSDIEEKESPHASMKPYLIAVICIGIVVGFIVLYKVFKQVRSGVFYVPCCDDRPAGNSRINRRDTFKPLVRNGSNSSDNGSSIYKHAGSQRSGGADMV